MTYVRQNRDGIQKQIHDALVFVEGQANVYPVSSRLVCFNDNGLDGARVETGRPQREESRMRPVRLRSSAKKTPSSTPAAARAAAAAPAAAVAVAAVAAYDDRMDNPDADPDYDMPDFDIPQPAHVSARAMALATLVTMANSPLSAPRVPTILRVPSTSTATTDALVTTAVQASARAMALATLVTMANSPLSAPRVPTILRVPSTSTATTDALVTTAVQASARVVDLAGALCKSMSRLKLQIKVSSALPGTRTMSY
jgi:hypothetical protein